MVKRIIKSCINSLLSTENAQEIIGFLANTKKVNLLRMGYKSVGILNHENMTVSGEKYVIEHILKPYALNLNRNLIAFDIGANVGDYSSYLFEIFPKGNIHSFEPNPAAFERLIKVNIQSHNQAMGSYCGEITMFIPFDDSTSPHCTTNRAFLGYDKEIKEIRVPLKTVTNFMSEHNMDNIDFLKIDTEGHDIEVIRGIEDNLLQNIAMIQFEMNEGMIEKRIQLRDFYSALPGFEFYRLMPNSLLPLGPYSQLNEIYRFQNILAVNKSKNISC